MPHELFIATRQTTKMKKAFANKISSDIKLSIGQISRTIQRGGYFCPWLANLRKKALTNVAIPLTEDNLPRLVSNLTSNAINKFERNISRKGAARAGPRKVGLFPEIGQFKFSLSLIRPHRRMCIGTYIFNLKTKKNQKWQEDQKQKKLQEREDYL